MATTLLHWARHPLLNPNFTLVLPVPHGKNSFALPSQLHQRACVCGGLSSSRFRKVEQSGRGKVYHAFIEEPSGEDEEEESFELLFRFVGSIIRRMSKYASKAAMDLLPPMISSQLVMFSVNGIVMLSLLWILKAVLELTCIVGSFIFFGILMMRGLWSILSYFQNQDVDSTEKIHSGVKRAYS